MFKIEFFLLKNIFNKGQNNLRGLFDTKYFTIEYA